MEGNIGIQEILPTAATKEHPARQTENHPTQNFDQLQRKFREHALHKTVITAGVRAEAKRIQHLSPEELQAYDLSSKAQDLFQDAGVNSEYRDLGGRVAENILGTELAIQQWVNESPDEQIETTDRVLAEVGINEGKVERMLGGFAVIVSPEVFQEKGVVTTLYADGKALDSDQVTEALAKIPEMGFVTAAQKINSSSSLPEGTKIMLIANNCNPEEQGVHEDGQRVDHVHRAKVHEEREGIGLALDAARNAPANEKLANAMSDLVARLANNETLVNLASLGFTPEDIMGDPDAVKVMQAITRGVNQMTSEGKNPKALADEIQGAILLSENPWKIASYVNKGKSTDQLLEGLSGVTLDHFKGIALKGDVEGRFVNNIDTLTRGSGIVLNGETYNVGAVIGRGASGAVYEARDTHGNAAAIKELLAIAPQALSADELTAQAWLRGVVENMPNSNRPDPNILLNFTLPERLKPNLSPAERHHVENQHVFGDVFLFYLNQKLTADFQGKNNGQQPFYNGNLQFNWNRDTMGTIIMDETLRQDAMAAISKAVGSYSQLTRQDATAVITQYIDTVGPRITGSRKEDLPILEKTFPPDVVRADLTEDVAQFIHANQIGRKLQTRGVPGVAGSIGLVQSGIHDPKDQRYDCYYDIQEFAPGEQLSKLLPTATWTVAERQSMMGDFLTILGGVHKEDIIHLDIKSSNLKLDGKKLTLTDFGIAKDKTSPATTVLAGTLPYNSPEHVSGGVDLTADIYSSGILLYELMTGDDVQQHMEQFGAQGFDLRQQYMRDELAKRPDIPPHITAVIMRATDRSPANRFQSATEMKQALDVLQTIKKPNQLDVLFKDVAARTYGHSVISRYQGLGVLNFWSENGVDQQNKYGLPDEFEKYLDEAEQLIATDPHQLESALTNLQKTAKQQWRNPQVRETMQQVIPDMAAKLTRDVLAANGTIGSKELIALCKIADAPRVNDLLNDILQKEPTRAVEIAERIKDCTLENQVDLAMQTLAKCLEEAQNLGEPSLSAVGKVGRELLQRRRFGAHATSNYYGPGASDNSWEEGLGKQNNEFGLPAGFEAYLRKLHAIRHRNPTMDAKVTELFAQLEKVSWQRPVDRTMKTIIAGMKPTVGVTTRLAP